MLQQLCGQIRALSSAFGAARAELTALEAKHDQLGDEYLALYTDQQRCKSEHAKKISSDYSRDWATLIVNDYVKIIKVWLTETQPFDVATRVKDPLMYELGEEVDSHTRELAEMAVMCAANPAN